MMDPGSEDEMEKPLISRCFVLLTVTFLLFSTTRCEDVTGGTLGTTSSNGDYTDYGETTTAIPECNEKQMKACQTNETENQCFLVEDSYYCECKPPYFPISNAEVASACILECNDLQNAACKTVISVTDNTTEETNNKCIKSPKDGYHCVCNDPYEGFADADGKNISCIPMRGECNEEQNSYCDVHPLNNNSCEVPDKTEDTVYTCICKPPFEIVINVTSQGEQCKRKLLSNCTDDQNFYCMVTTIDNVPTRNKCGQPDPEDLSKYVCNCEDSAYREVKNNDSVVVNCTRKECDEAQKESCKMEDNGKPTGNRCTLPIPLNPHKHKCICEMPYFISTGEEMESICDILPPGEYYLHKPKDQTVVEGEPVLLECVVDRALNECLWKRGDKKVSPSVFANSTYGSSKYTFQGHACDGICSLRINSALLAHDNTKWTCIPILEGMDIPAVAANVEVVVLPRDPWLVYERKNLVPDALVYIQFFRANAKRIQVKCISEAAYPAATHTWMQDKETVTTSPFSSFTQDVMADTITTTSSSFFVLKKNVETLITCTASNSDRASKSVSATFVSTAPTTVVSILYLLEEDWYTPPYGIIVLEHPSETVLQCDANGRPEPQYTWQEKVNGQWEPVGFLESYIVTTHTRTLRCLAGNSENAEPVPSPPVTIQRKGSGDLPGPGTGPPDKVPSKYEFVLQPEDRFIGPGALFELTCQVNGPVHTCMWNRRDMEKNELGALPEYAFTGDKDDGFCSIHIMNAGVDSLGGWTCLPVLYDGNVLPSREAIVSGLHFSLFPDGTDDAWRFRPQMSVNGKVATPDELIVLNKDDSSITWMDVTADCNAYSRTDDGEMMWKLGDKAYEKYPSSRIPIPSDPPVFLISSTVDFILNSLLKTTDVPHSLLLEVGCKVAGRQKIAFVAGDWTYLRSNEIKVTLTLEHPTRDVVVVPQGYIQLGMLSDSLLVCTCNGFPPPRIQWQEYGTEWMDISEATEPSLRVTREGQYRCTAGNKHNLHGYLPSEPVILGEGEMYVTESGSFICPSKGVIILSLATIWLQIFAS